jgi:hypothetical protein
VANELYLSPEPDITQMVPVKVTVATIDSGFFWTRLIGRQRTDIENLIIAHGHDYHHVQSITYDVLDLPLLRICKYLFDEEDRILADGLEPVVRDHEVPLRTPLPDWWTPELPEPTT